MVFRNSHAISGHPTIPPNIVQAPLSFQYFSARLNFFGFLHGNPKPSRQQGWNHLDLSRLPRLAEEAKIPMNLGWNDCRIISGWSYNSEVLSHCGTRTILGGEQKRGTNQQQSTSSPNATYLGPAFSSTCTAYRVAATGLSQKKWRISCLLSNRQFSLEPGSWVIQPCQKERATPKNFL